jgi:foldase protein PrsA
MENKKNDKGNEIESRFDQENNELHDEVKTEQAQPENPEIDILPVKKGRNKGLMFAIILGAVVILGVGAFLVFSLLNKPAATKTPSFVAASGYVATVGGTQISTDLYKIYLNEIKSSAEKQNNIDDSTRASFWSQTGSSGQTNEDLAKGQTLDKAEVYTAYYLKATAAGKKVDAASINKKVDDAINAVKTQYKLKTKEEATVKLEQTIGGSISAYALYLTESQMFDEYMTSESSNMTDKSAKYMAFYNANKSELETSVVRHILFAVDPSVVAKSDANQKKKAQDTLNKIKNGANMGDLAKTLSDDNASQNLGVYGINKLNASQMVTEFSNWALTKKVGDLEIVKSSYGYHVMRKEKVVKTFADLSKQDIVKTEFTDYLINELRTDAKYKFATNESGFKAVKII